MSHFWVIEREEEKPSIRQESNPRPQEFCSADLCSTVALSNEVLVKNYWNRRLSAIRIKKNFLDLEIFRWKIGFAQRESFFTQIFLVPTLDGSHETIEEESGIKTKTYNSWADSANH